MPHSGGRKAEILERGEILFLYQPRVEEEDPSGLGDVQRFYVVLWPEGSSRFRLLVVGRKRLADVAAHERAWGFVDLVTDDAGALERALRAGERETKTRGERRHQPAARPAGAGAYAVSLEGWADAPVLRARTARAGAGRGAAGLRHRLGGKLRAVGQEPGGRAPLGAGLARAEKAEFPEELQREFHGRRFAAENVRLLDIEGAEFILVGARRDPERAYGLDIEPRGADRHRDEILRELRDLLSRRPARSLFEEHWE
jgi:hypothetical protein